MARRDAAPDAAALGKLLPGVGPQAVAQLSAAASTLTYRTGQPLYAANEPGDPGVVVSGLLRSVVTLRDGRRATVHYVAPSGLYGLPRLFNRVQTSVEAVRETTVIAIDAATVTRVALEFPRFGWFVSQQLSDLFLRLPTIVEELGFKSVRQRVASHLLVLAIRDPNGTLRVVDVSQQGLAEAVCSVREVVSRALRSLKQDGLIDLVPPSIVITDEAGLRRASL